MCKSVLGIGYSLPYDDDDFAFTKLPAKLDEAAKLQPDFVELPLFSLDVIAAGRVMPERLKRLKVITTGRGHGYTVHAPLAINLLEDEARLPMAKAVLRACLDVAAEVDAVHFVLHPGIYDKHHDHEAEVRYTRQRDILAEIAEVAQTLGLIIAVENLYPGHSSRRTPLPSRLAAEIGAINHPNLWACLDFSHAFVHASHAGVDPMSEVAALAPFAKHLHVHGSFGRISYQHMSHRTERLAFGEGDLHLPLGMGCLPWDRFMEELVFAAGVILNLELAPPYWSELAASVAALRQLAAHAKTAGAPA